MNWISFQHARPCIINHKNKQHYCTLVISLPFPLDGYPTKLPDIYLILLLMRLNQTSFTFLRFSSGSDRFLLIKKKFKRIQDWRSKNGCVCQLPNFFIKNIFLRTKIFSLFLFVQQTIAKSHATKGSFSSSFFMLQHERHKSWKWERNLHARKIEMSHYLHGRQQIIRKKIEMGSPNGSCWTRPQEFI